VRKRAERFHPMSNRVLLVVWTAAWLFLTLVSGAAGQMPPAQVKVAVVQQRELDVRQTFVGSVEPWRTSTVASQIEGLVTEVTVREGDEVGQNDPLAKLEADLLKAQLAAAIEKRKVLRQFYKALQESLPKQIEEAEARKKAAEAVKEFLRVRWERAQKLKATNAISDDEVQQRESAHVAALHKVTESRAAWAVLDLTEEEEYAQANAQLAAHKNEVKRLQIEKKRHTITAPFSGYVSKEYTEEGQWVAKGDPVAELLDLNFVYVEVPVPEEYVSALEKDVTQAEVTIEALPGKSWKAPVVAIVQKADPRSRSFPVKVRLSNTRTANGMLLKAGMLAHVSLPVGAKGKALLVPKDAVVLGGRLPIVYVVDPMPAVRPPKGAAGKGPPASAGPLPNGIARQVAVELSPGVDDLIVVRGPLKPGDRVVVEGNERLFPGRPLIVINPKKPAAKPSE